MNIAVIIRSVPDTEAKLRISGNDINREDIDFIVNPYDEFAAEEALKLKEKAGDASIDVYAIGPGTADKQLKWALSIGIDEAFRLSTDAWYNIEERKQAEIYYNIIKEKEYDFIFIGKKSIDYDISNLPFYLGNLMNYKIMPATISFEYMQDENMAEMQGLIDSRKIIRKGKPPMIICCEKGLNEPRYPSLKNIMKAKKKKINTIDISPKEIKESIVDIQKLIVLSMQRKSEILKGERNEIAKKVACIISQDIKAL